MYGDVAICCSVGRWIFFCSEAWFDSVVDGTSWLLFDLIWLYLVLLNEISLVRISRVRLIVFVKMENIN